MGTAYSIHTVKTGPTFPMPTPMRRFITMLVLALPLIAVIVYHFSVVPSSSWDRTMAFIILPFATLICWVAVWVPRW